MPPARLLLDEDVRPQLAVILRDRGYDAMHVRELGRRGASDAELLEYAAESGRTILTHNVSGVDDAVAAAVSAVRPGVERAGRGAIIDGERGDVGVVAQAVLAAFQVSPPSVLLYTPPDVAA